MSEVSKWNAPRGTTLSEAADGEYVLTPDYDALRAKLDDPDYPPKYARRLIAELRAESERLSGIVNKAWNKSHVLESGSYIPGALDAWKRPVLQHLPYGIFGSTSQTANQYCNGWNDAGGYWKAHADDLLAELAAMKAVPEGVTVVGYLNTASGEVVKYGPTLMDWDDEKEPVESLMTVAQHNARIAEKDSQIEALDRQFQVNATLRQPVAGEREAFEARMLRRAPSCNLQRIGDRYACIDMQWKFDVWMARAALSAPAAGHKPVAYMAMNSSGFPEKCTPNDTEGFAVYRHAAGQGQQAPVVWATHPRGASVNEDCGFVGESEAENYADGCVTPLYAAPAAGQEPVAWTVAYPPSYRPYMHQLSFISEQDAEAYVDQNTPAEKGCVVVPLYAAPIAPPAEDTGQDVSSMANALSEIRRRVPLPDWARVRIDTALAAHKAGGEANE